MYFKKIFIFIILLVNLSSLAYSKYIPHVNTNNILTMIANSKGKVVIVNFFASWCPYCVREVKELVEIRKEYSTDDLKIMGISFDSNQESYIRLLEKSKINYPTYLASGREIGMMFNVFGIPTTIIYDKDGRIVKQLSGFVGIDKFKHIIDQLIKK